MVLSITSLLVNISRALARRAATKMRSILGLLCLLVAVLGSEGAAESCSFSFPSTSDPSECEEYDLSKIAALGGANITSSYTYVLTVCENLQSSRIPAACRSQPPAPAYQYSDTSCIAIGNLSSPFAYPVDPTDSTAGIRIGYNNGDGVYDNYWPRAVIIDFYCDSSAGIGTPQYVLEYPSYTYKVRWPSAFACPVTTVKGQSCPLPKFAPTWDSLRFRPRPSWYDNVKFGIFIHWGIFSVPAFKNEWYWKRLMDGDSDYVEFHNRVYGCSGVKPDKFPCTGPNFTYPEFAPMFKAELWDPDAWATLFKNAGAKYVVLTSKHHEGWCNFKNSYHWNWNSIDEGPKRDLVGDLTNSVRKAGLRMGLYHSLREWFNPAYIDDQADNCSTTAFVDDILLPTMKQMVEEYQPEVIWADGAGDAPCTHSSIKYWKSPQFLSWLYNESPVGMTTVVNSRWGTPAIGDYETGSDRYSPGHLVPNKWESCYTIQETSWGYDRTEGIDQFWSTLRLLEQLVESVSCNGNLLLNVGPTHDGRIVPAFQERLLEMGAWLKINGEAIYDSIPWKFQNDTENMAIWYTSSKDGKTVYATSFKAPTPGEEFVLKRAVPTADTDVSLLGYDEGPLEFTASVSGLLIKIPLIPFGELKYAWTFKLTNLA